MLTRIEVDGFKNLLGFSAEFGTFTCIAGPNAVGKSNLFDAIEFLSLLAELPVRDAAKRIRGADRDIRDLLWTNGEQRAEEMSFAVEMLIAQSVRDEFGRLATLETNVIRYVLHLRYFRPDELSGPDVHLSGQLLVVSEALHCIPKSEFESRVHFSGREELFEPKFLEAESADPQRLEPEGTLLAAAGGMLPRTALSMSSSLADGALWLAVRHELRSWRRLALRPDAVRAPSSFDEIDAPMATDGAGLTAAIYRMAHRQQGGEADPEAVYAELANWLSVMTPVRKLDVHRDDLNRRLTLEVTSNHDGTVPLSALSDGTLRFLALASLALEARPGLICIDEVENGIHPTKTDELLTLLRRLATETREDAEDAGGEQQVIISTHSPLVVRGVHDHDPGELVIAKAVAMRGPGAIATTGIRLLSLSETWRDRHDGTSIGLASIAPYLLLGSV